MMSMKTQDGEINIQLLLVMVLGFGVILFAILTVVGFSGESNAKSTLNTQKQLSFSLGQKNQKATDDTATRQAAETPYHTYTAPTFAGSFAVSFPKAWSAAVTESESSSTQVDLQLNPDFITTKAGVAVPLAVDVQLQNQTAASLTTQENSQLGTTLKSSNITVSGITATEYIGAYGNTHKGAMVVVPVRDKSLVFYNQNSDYLTEFNQVLAQAKINP